MRTQYASTPTPPPPAIAVISGSTTAAVAGAKYLWIYCRNRVGVTAFSTRVDTAIAEGDALQITLPSTIRKAASDIHEIGIVLSTSNTPETGCVVATYPGFDVDGVTLTALPASITLSHDIHFQLFAVVATPANLPTSNRINGMRRYVNSTAQFVAWSSQQSEWVLVRPQKFNPYVVTTTEEEGADVDLSKIEDYSLVITPDYDVSGSLSVPVTYWIVNDGSAEIPQGRRVRISCATTTGDAASDDFKGLMEITFLGYVNTSTGALDISGMSVGSSQTYQGDVVTNLLLQKPLPANSAYALQVQMAFDYADAKNSAYQGEVVKIYPYLTSNYAGYDPAYSDLGDRIFPEGGQRRILPNGPGLTLSAATGSGSIKFYKWLNIGQDEVFGATANTSDQNVIVTNNGACFVAATIPDTAVLRAVISSVDGVGHPTTWSSAIALDATKRLTVTLTHSTAIRTDYPDVIAGTTATLNASKARIYVRVVGSGTITYFDAPILGTTGEEITVGSLAGANIGALPSVAASHGLFNLSGFTRSSVTGSSIFTTNNYEVAIAYLYENTITAISHDTALGCVLELGSTLTDAIAVSKIIGQPVADIAALRAVAEANISAWQVRYVVSVENEYRFNSASTEVDDGNLVVKPDDIISGSPGRWIAFSANKMIAVEDIAELKAIPPGDRANNQIVGVRDSGDTTPKIYIFDADATTGGETPDTGTGRWMAASSAGGGGTGTDITRISTTSNTIGTGSKTFSYASSSNLGWLIGTRLRAANNVSNYIEGVITSVSSTSVTIVADNAVGSGTFASWNLALTGDKGSDGIDGDDGVDGDSSYTYIAYADDSSGTGFTNTFSSSKDFIAIKTTASPIASPTASDFTGLWKNYKGATGATGSVAAASELIITESGSASSATANQIKLDNVNNEFVVVDENGVVTKVAYIDKAQSYPKTQSSTIVSISGNGTITLDGSASNIFIITPTGNITLTMNNVQVGATYIIYIIEDATGGAVITLNSIFKRLVGDTTTFNTAANRVNMITGIARASNAITLAPIAVEAP